MKNRILWINAVFFLCIFNFLIFQKEKLLASGREVYLELAPADPRSLLQGDYMALRYRVATDTNLQGGGSEDGFIVAKMDENHVGTFSHVASADADLRPDEIKIKFRKRGFSIKIATDAFFFQNGQASHYNQAKYGILKVSEDGEALLVGLATGPGNKL